MENPNNRYLRIEKFDDFFFYLIIYSVVLYIIYYIIKNKREQKIKKKNFIVMIIMPGTFFVKKSFSFIALQKNPKYFISYEINPIYERNDEKLLVF